MRIKLAAAGLLLLVSVFAAASMDVHGQDVIELQAESQDAVKHDTSKKLKDLPKIKPKDLEGLVLGKKLLPNRLGSKGKEGDEALQAESSPGAALPSTAQNFEGIANVNGVLPPDTVGDIGPNHYVQMVNLSLAVWDRSGTLLYGPVNANTLWQGFGGACETSNDGDPIVLYDHLADRWLLTQFALPNFPSGPFYECLAVSATGDPLGAYHRYQFVISNTKLNDYPKFGVWPDGYYMSVNQFTCTVANCSWAGAAAVVFERTQMLNGLAARGVKFDLFGVDPNLGGMLPADLDGAMSPPAGAPNPFLQVDDDAWGYSGDQLQVWNFHVDWTTPSSSTFTLAGAIPTAAFDSNMCGYSRSCIPQPGTSARLDAIADRLMYRLQYRNFGTHQTLVTNHTVDANGADRAGIRWYELRSAGGGWSIHQQGTYSPDANNRWMASAAMNGIGDIGLGFSIASANIFPSIGATGRLDSDAPGTITQGEVALAAGSGVQTHSASRWGDYSALSVDPIDDCTFWYTQEYYAVTGPASWQTRVGAFKLRDCGAVDAPPTVTLEFPAEGSTVSGPVAVEIAASDNETALGGLTVEWNVDGGAWQPAAYNAALNRYTASWDTTTVGDGVHTVTARATDSGTNTATDSNTVTVDNVADPPPTTLHVGDLDRSTIKQKSSWTAIVTIGVHNTAHAAQAGAVVTGTWSNGAAGTATCTTTAAGTCSVSKGGVCNRTTSVTFTVTNVAVSGMTYTAVSNHDPDGDSSGTSITVLKP